MTYIVQQLSNHYYTNGPLDARPYASFQNIFLILAGKIHNKFGTKHFFDFQSNNIE